MEEASETIKNGGGPVDIRKMNSKLGEGDSDVEALDALAQSAKKELAFIEAGFDDLLRKSEAAEVDTEKERADEAKIDAFAGEVAARYIK